jgi:predicted  nucleic acid-binding Zn-ribbon protein
MDERKMFDKIKQAASILKTTAVHKLDEAKSKLENINMASMNYTKQLEYMKQKVKSHQAEIEEATEEIAKLQIAISNLEDDRNLKYFRTKIKYAEDLIRRKTREIGVLNHKMSSIISKLRSEQLR